MNTAVQREDGILYEDVVEQRATRADFLNNTRLFACGCLLGATVFVLVYGFSVLNVTQTGWLFGNQDLTQHYLGWQAFRQSRWMFPIGLTDGLYYPLASSIVYTDSIPLLAIPFKALSPFLPANFQYFGLWEFLCFSLQGGFSVVVLSRFIKHKKICLIGSAFFLLSMPLLLRTCFHHDALSAHWILLLAIALWVYRVGENRPPLRCFIWGCVGLLCAFVHIYFIPMVGIILLGATITDVCLRRGLIKAMLPIAFFIAASLFGLWILGAFHGEFSAYTYSAGSYVSNLNAFINPLDQGVLLKQLPTVFGNYEGSAYLGVGVLLLLAAIPFLLFSYPWQGTMKGTRAAFFAGAVVMALFSMMMALGPDITINGKVLFSIRYPDFVKKLFAVFRASGRFIWVAYYLLLTGAIVFVSRRLSRSIGGALIIACLCVQIVDSQALLNHVRAEYDTSKKTTVPLLSDDLLKELAQNPAYRHIQYLEPLGVEDTLAFAEYALQNQRTVSCFYFARPSDCLDTQRQDEWERIVHKGAASDTIYIAKYYSGVVLNANMLYWYRVQDFAIGVKEEIPRQRDRMLAKNSLDILPNNTQFLKNGEDNQKARVLYENGLSYGPYTTLQKGKYHVVITGENLMHGTFEWTTDGGKIKTPLTSIARDQTRVEFDFCLDADKSLCEMVVYNPDKEAVVINRIELKTAP